MEEGKRLKFVKKMGLSENEAKCYLALLERQSLSVAEVAKLTGIARPNVYEATERLLVKGLSIALPGKVKNYSAVDPSFLKEKALNDIDNAYKIEIENLEKKKKEINSCNSEIEDLKHLFNNSRGDNNPLDYISVLKDPRQIHRKFIELFSKAEKEVLIFVKPPFACATNKEFEEQRVVQNEATERGVAVKGIYEKPPDDQIENFLKNQKIKTNQNPGDECRIIDKLPIKLNIYDDKACFFTLVDPIKERTSLTMLVAEHEALTLSFKMLFESVWEKAKNYYVHEGIKYYLNEFVDDDKFPSYKRKLVTKLL